MEWNKTYNNVRLILVLLAFFTVLEHLAFGLANFIILLITILPKLILIIINYVYVEKLNALISSNTPLTKSIRVLEFVSWIAVVSYAYKAVGIIQIFNFKSMLESLGYNFLITNTMVIILSILVIIYLIRTFKFRKVDKGIYYNYENKDFKHDSKKPYIPWYGMLLYTLVICFFFAKLVYEGNTESSFFLLFMGLIFSGIIGIFISLFIAVKIIK